MFGSVIEMFGIDPLYWIMMLPVFLLSLFASFNVKRTFKRFERLATRSGMTGADVAREILRLNGLRHVQVEETRGFLSDHYDPRSKVVRLSPNVYRSPSIAAIGVAAHETGHAIQHSRAYAPLTLRNFMVPVASIGSNFAWIIIIGGFFLNLMGLVKLGIILFSAVVLFQLLTLPVEFDASARAKQLLGEYAFVSPQELVGVRKVLFAAAMTYVAAAASAIVTLLYFLLRAGVLGGDD